MHLSISVELYCCVEDGWGRLDLRLIIVVLSQAIVQDTHRVVSEVSIWVILARFVGNRMHGSHAILV